MCCSSESVNRALFSVFAAEPSVVCGCVLAPFEPRARDERDFFFPLFIFGVGSYLANATPTFIFRNLDGDAPCPVPIVCIGWPLPQFGVPHNVQCSALQMASQEFQNSGGNPL